MAIEKKKNAFNPEKHDPFEYDVHWWIKIKEGYRNLYLRFCSTCGLCCTKICKNCKWFEQYNKELKDRKYEKEKYNKQTIKYHHVNFDQNITDSLHGPIILENKGDLYSIEADVVIKR